METVGTQIPQALSQNRHSRLLLSEVAPNASLAVERVENARGPTARALTLARLPITLAMPSRLNEPRPCSFNREGIAAPRVMS